MNLFDGCEKDLVDSIPMGFNTRLWDEWLERLQLAAGEVRARLLARMTPHELHQLGRAEVRARKLTNV